MKIIASILSLFALSTVYSQTPINPNTGDAYLLFGPNSSWNEYFQVGGNGRVTTNAGIFATNGNLHLDSKNGSFKTYINHYSQGHTILNSQGGKVGIGTSNPSTALHISSSQEHHQLRIQGSNDKHAWMQFYPSGNGVMNWQIGANGSGFSIYDLQNASYKFTITNSGNVGIGTTAPTDKFEIRDGNLRISRGSDRMYLKVDDQNAKSLIAFGDDANDRLAFYYDHWNGTSSDKEVMSIHANGRVGIGTGTATPDAKLTVNGQLHAEEVKVDLNVPGPDYVFKESYDLKTLEEVQAHIKAKGHLPNIPSAAEMETNGIELGEMNMKLLEKIEELTLYVIDLKKENQLQNTLIQKLLNNKQ